MARSHFWQYVLNNEGVPISGAIVRLFDDSDDSQVSFYTRTSSASTTTYTTTSTAGLFEIWVPDRTETNGYGSNSTYTLIISGGAMETRTITGVQLLFQPPRMVEADMFTRLNVDDLFYYSKNIVHDLNTQYPCIQAWNIQTRQTMEVSCSSIDETTVSVSAYYESIPSASWPEPSIPIRIVLLGEDL
jgi:hypothetical protein